MLYLDNFFSLKLSIIIVLLVSVLTLVLSNYVYVQHNRFIFNEMHLLELATIELNKFDYFFRVID